MSKREQFDKRLRNVVKEQLGSRDHEITTTANFVDDLGADSLDQVELVMAVEEEFEMEISDADAEKIETYGQALDYLLSREA